MGLTTGKPNVDAFIAGAKADSLQVPADMPGDNLVKAKGTPEGEGVRARGKARSKYMATIDDATMSRYQLRIPRKLHGEAKSAAALAGIAFCDYILEAVVEKMARDNAARDLEKG